MSIFKHKLIIFLIVMFRCVRRKCKEVFNTDAAQHFSEVLCR